MHFVEELDVDITLDEVVEAISKLKRYKAAGVDGFVTEVLKYGGDKVCLAVLELCRTAWRTETVIQDWAKGLIFPIFKEGRDSDKRNPTD